MFNHSILYQPCIPLNILKELFDIFLQDDLSLALETKNYSRSFVTILKIVTKSSGDVKKSKSQLDYGHEIRFFKKLSQCAVGLNNLNKKAQEVSHFSNVQCS